MTNSNKIRELSAEEIGNVSGAGIRDGIIDYLVGKAIDHVIEVHNDATSGNGWMAKVVRQAQSKQ